MGLRMQLRTVLAGMFAVVLLAATNDASAREQDEWGVYVAADAGATAFSVGKTRLDRLSEVPAGDSWLDKRDRGFSLAVGLRMSRNWAIEASYLDLGRSSYLIEDDTGTATLGFGSRGIAVSLLGVWPINDFLALDGRAGLYLSNANFHGWFSANFNLLDGDLEYLEGEGGGDPGLLLGVGVVASLGDYWSLRLGYDRINGNALAIRNTAAGASLESNAGRVSLGFRYELW